MISNELRDRLIKIYELVKRGNDGEQSAAQRALDKLLEKHNIQGIDLDSLDRECYFYKYSTDMELWLLSAIVRCLIDDADALDSARRQTRGVRQLKLFLRFVDSVKVDCAYEYFRRHMKKEWQKVCAPELKKKRKATTLKKRRTELQSLFFSAYLIKSGLYKEGDIATVEPTSKQEYNDRMKLLDIEGGDFKTQVSTGNLLN